MYPGSNSCPCHLNSLSYRPLLGRVGTVTSSTSLEDRKEDSRLEDSRLERSLGGGGILLNNDIYTTN